MELKLYEELLMLGLDDETGEIILPASAALPYGLAGAILLELFFARKIQFENERIVPLTNQVAEDSILDEALKLISNKNNESAKYWIRNINSEMTNLVERIEDGLVAKKILQKVEKKILWIIPVERYPTLNPISEASLRIHIRAIVLENSEPDDRMLALLSLIKASNLVDELFLKDERKQAKTIISNYIIHEKIGKLVSDVSAEVTAIIASTVAGSVAAASVSAGVY